MIGSSFVSTVCRRASLWGGHYYAHARHPESGARHTFNDAGVSAFDPAGLEAGSGAAYLLFYGRRGARGAGGGTVTGARP